MRIISILSLASLLGTGCAINSPVSGIYHVPPEAASECSTHCNTIGMQVAAVVIASGSFGCVCESSKTTDAEAGGNVAAVGGAAIKEMIDLQARQAQAQSQRQAQQSAQH
ncbi:MAG: hypothetical protein V2A73_12010 [Pseudomonadota bacterium]